VAALGTLVMVSEDFGAGGDTLRGDVYALLGAVLAAGFLLSGRVVLGDNRRWLPFSTVTYSVAALILVVMVLLAGDSFTGYSSETYLYFALLALIPQLVGHSAINRSLGHLPAFAVSLAIQGEPVGATVLAALLLDETPTALQLIGGALVLAGVYAGLRAERRVTAVVNPSP
jgi:drug/metabolite transporter (DMT)-like permease